MTENKRYKRLVSSIDYYYCIDTNNDKGLTEKDMLNRLNEQYETIQEYKHLVKIATSLIVWNTIPQVRREWEKHLSKVGDD